MYIVAEIFEHIINAGKEKHRNGTYAWSEMRIFPKHTLDEATAERKGIHLAETKSCPEMMFPERKKNGLNINDSSKTLTMEQCTWLEAETRLICLSCGSDLVYPIHEVYQSKIEVNSR